MTLPGPRNSQEGPERDGTPRRLFAVVRRRDCDHLFGNGQFDQNCAACVAEAERTIFGFTQQEAADLNGMTLQEWRATYRYDDE